LKPALEDKDALPAKPLAFVFNGDADGLISQHLLYLAGKTPELRITGLKRDIALLGRLPEGYAGDVHVLDLSFKTNAEAARLFLQKSPGTLTWYDHHESGELPDSPRLKAHIHATQGQCTALIANGVLGHAYPLWAAAAAFGDNVTASAEALLQGRDLSEVDRTDLKNLGELLNYNAYGEAGDTLFQPLELAGEMEHYRDALDFYRDGDRFHRLSRQLADDARQSESLGPWKSQGQAHVYLVPNAPWARRFGATWMNRLIRAHGDQAFAIFQEKTQGGYLVSLRAPQSGPLAKWSASAFAGQYPTGGGRVQAAGINHLPQELLQTCASEFLRQLAG